MGTNTQATINGVTLASTVTGPVGMASSQTSRIVSAANSTNATVAKATGGAVFRITGQNTNAAARYLKLYDKATAPTVGTDTPVETLPLPASSPFNFEWSNGRSFSAGISYALTTGSADNDTGALTAGDVVGLNVDFS
ncbi:MAG TPA: hypothetical protein VFM48_08205 [Aquabacterium sp.]|nr:hypothetical protein [Aquabacterium sp.]